MQYIADSDGRLLHVSFGAAIKCSEQECVEYTGSVPSGYDSLASWYLVEAENLYKWLIVDGNLTLDSEATEPRERVQITLCDFDPWEEYAGKAGSGLHHIEPYYNSDGKAGLLIYNDDVVYIVQFSDEGMYLRYYKKGVGLSEWTLSDSSGGGVSGDYLPLSGGVMTGPIQLQNGVSLQGVKTDNVAIWIAGVGSDNCVDIGHGSYPLRLHGSYIEFDNQIRLANNYPIYGYYNDGSAYYWLIGINEDNKIGVGNASLPLIFHGSSATFDATSMIVDGKGKAIAHQWEDTDGVVYKGIFQTAAISDGTRALDLYLAANGTSQNLIRLLPDKTVLSKRLETADGDQYALTSELPIQINTAYIDENGHLWLGFEDGNIIDCGEVASLAQYLPLDGGTMTGTLMIQSGNIEAGTTPSSGTTGKYIRFADKNDVTLASIYPYISANGRVSVMISPRLVVDGTTVYNELQLGVNPDGSRIVWMSDAAAWRSAIGTDTVVTPDSVKLITSGAVSAALDDLPYVGANLLLNTGAEQSIAGGSGWRRATYYLSDYGAIQTGGIYTLTVCFTPGTGLTGLQLNNSGGIIFSTPYNIAVNGSGRQTTSITFTATKDESAHIRLYAIPTDGTNTGATTIHWAKLERGSKATDWTPAPDDCVSKYGSIMTGPVQIASDGSTVKVLLQETSDGRGNIQLLRSGIKAVNMYTTSSGGEVDICDSSGNTRAALFVDSSGNGQLRLYASDGSYASLTKDKLQSLLNLI